MLVKKYEAQTVKQAIELVKTELGPEAIILGARENNASFGLGGSSSVEVTAAISEHKLREKVNAEKKLNKENRESFLKASAKNQKEFIAKALQSEGIAGFGLVEEEAQATSTPASPAVPRPITTRRYIDIPEEGSAPSTPVVQATAPQPGQAMPPRVVTTESPTERVAPQVTVKEDTAQISALKQEISHLKTILEKFQKVPQGFVSSHPGAEYGISYDLSHSFKKLLEAGVDEDNLVDLFKRAEEALPPQQKKKRAFVEAWLIRQFLDSADVVTSPDFGRYHVFLGPTGQGKTSSVVKFASQLVLKAKRKVAVLSADSQKVGAQDQLKIYCQILNVPFGVIDREVDWQSLDKNLQGIDHILIDTGGVNLRGSTDIDYVRRSIPKGFEHDTRIHYVQSIMARDKDAFEVADRFKLFNFHDAIFTRLDEAVQFGFIHNFSKRYGIPIHSFGTGTDIPDCYEFASKERVVDLIFGLSKAKEGRS